MSAVVNNVENHAVNIYHITCNCNLSKDAILHFLVEKTFDIFIFCTCTCR